jgi:glycosyltransferase involved in cell wall biosynthesis
MEKTPEAPSGVSYVMPIYNEVDYVEAAVSSILAQDFDGPVELVLALAPSTDGTDELVHQLAAADERITVVDNPGMHIPIGLNRAIAAARHPVVIRVDAHTQLEPDYTKRGVAELDEVGAANLGGIMVATGRPGFQAAVARAYNSRLGLGGASYHHEHAQPGPAESAYLGIMQVAAVRGIGGFDETVRRGEDWEMNFRLRQAGHLVWLDPSLRVTYWPRDTWNKLARQFLSTGIWRGELTRRLGAKNPLRFFAPPVLVANLVVALVVALLQVTGVLSGTAGWIASLVHLGPLAYVCALVVAAVTAKGSLLDRLRYVVVLATMHLCWGAGFIVGSVRGGGDSVDTSRVDT